MQVLFVRLQILLAILLTGVSCNNESTPRQVNDTSTLAPPTVEQPAAAEGINGCYMRVNGRDTLFVQLASSAENVTGKIWFDNHQYDGSSGNLHGKLYNNTLRMLYNFEAEGAKNVMELIFKVEDQSIIRAEGEMGVKDDTTYFADPSRISFPDSGRLTRVSCSGWNKN